MKVRIFGGLLVVVFLSGVIFFSRGKSETSSRTPSAVDIPDDFFVRDLDKELGESFEDGDLNKEKQYIARVVNTFLKFIRDVKAKSADPTTKRGAHAKALACLKGEFEIQNGALPEALRVGIFAKNKEVYRSWIRVSNSEPDPFSKDNAQNTRGFAIKLLGVGGEKLLEREQNVTTLDILHVAAEAFVARDNFNYSDIADQTEGPIRMAVRLGFTRTRDLLSAVLRAKNEMNPLRLDYFSTVPYRLGPAQGEKKAIKFRTVLCNLEDGKKFPAGTADRESLIKNIADTINSVESVCLNFQVQMAGARDKVEDATTRWNSEYKTVGQLKISRRDNPESALGKRGEFCEHLSFNPWRTLAVHRPLGRINRARKTTYLMSSLFRHQQNKTSLEEPGPDSFEKIP